MKKIFINPEMKIAVFDGIIGTTTDPVFVSGNVNDAKLSLENVENIMVKRFTDLEFIY